MYFNYFWQLLSKGRQYNFVLTKIITKYIIRSLLMLTFGCQLLPYWYIYTVSQKNWATFIFTVTLANVGRFLKFFQFRNQKEVAHNKNEKFPTVA